MSLQLREIAKLTVKFGQAGEIQAVFQSWKDLRQRSGCLLKRNGATDLFPFKGRRTWNTEMAFPLRYRRKPRP